MGFISNDHNLAVQDTQKFRACSGYFTLELNKVVYM